MSNVLTNLSPPGRFPASALTWLPVLVGLVALYFPVYAYLLKFTWSQDNHAHGPMILAMSLYLAWQRRDIFSADYPSKTTWAGWLFIVLGLMFYALGQSQEVILLAVAAQIPLLIGIILLTRGVAALRALWFAIFFLIFMIPLPGFLVDGLTGALKLHVSSVAEQILYMLDYPVARNGVTISMGQYQLLVADACSGLYSMFSLSAVGLLYIYQMQRGNWLRNAMLVASILPIAFLANAVRVVVLALITYHFGEAAGQGLAHDLASPMLFSVAVLFMAGLDGVLGLFLKARHKLQPAAAATPQAAPHAKSSGMRHIALGLSLASGLGLAFALTPTIKVSELGPRVDLENMIPKQFGDWNFDPMVAPLQTDPETAATLDRLYNQILSRTYVDSRNRRVMLLIAYGGDQSESMQVHKPEVCYPSLGFQIHNVTRGGLDTGLGQIPVGRMVAVLGQRVEPVTYWMTLGDKIAEGGGGAWKLEQIKYGLTGKIPDGLLFRVSSITNNDGAAFQAQQDFTRDLIRALPEKDRARFIGHPGVQ
jgi:exosortase B